MEDFILFLISLVLETIFDSWRSVAVLLTGVGATILLIWGGGLIAHGHDIGVLPVAGAIVLYLAVIVGILWFIGHPMKPKRKRLDNGIADGLVAPRHRMPK